MGTPIPGAAWEPEAQVTLVGIPDGGTKGLKLPLWAAGWRKGREHGVREWRRCSL